MTTIVHNSAVMGSQSMFHIATMGIFKITKTHVAEKIKLMVIKLGMCTVLMWCYMCEPLCLEKHKCDNAALFMLENTDTKY